MKKIRVVKRDDRKKVNGEWEHVSLDKLYQTVEILEAKNRREAFKIYQDKLGKT